MAIDESEKLVQIVQDLTASTTNGDIDWVKANPTTYSWINPNGRVTLQRVAAASRPAVGVVSRPTVSYYLEVADNVGAPQLNVSSKKSSEVAVALQALYEGIVSTMTLKGVDFLSDMMKSVKG